MVSLVLGAATILVTAQQSAISQRQHEIDLNIANNQLQESLLKTFRDDIDHLIFDQHLPTAKHDDPVQIMAQSYTNDALRKLDLSRRVLLVQFLSDLHLVTSTTKDPPLISLMWIDLQGADLFSTNLQGADLFEANLQGTNFEDADLEGANFEDANLSKTVLVDTQVTPEQLAEAWRLDDATLPDGSRYPSSSYPIPNH